ncbi:porin family protein [Veronia pacifica]|uniref:Outer membrane protein beta-barrel domain-containing protein n=1 Tax=Veronia pacifica TaxID=1080227 RepID=A0A1C3EPP2_9GAMM|nr:porin family protein [Veronia pacifica]ODA35218.1 hypothetical protein A8L45_04710 [Veronia pacifica]
MKTPKWLWLVAVMLVSGATQADEFSGWYVTAGTGFVTGKVGSDKFKAVNNPQGFNITGGYQLNRFIGVEAGLQSYGKMRVLDRTADPRSISISANIGYRMDNGLRPFILFGFGSFILNEVSAGKSERIAGNDEVAGLHTALGLEYRMDHWALRISQHLVDAKMMKSVETIPYLVESKKTVDIPLTSTVLSLAYHF